MSLPPALHVEGLSYQYPTGADWVLRNISFSVEAGEFLGIVGPTGAGKTTLALCLRGLIPHNTGGILAGDVTVGGHSLRQTEPAQLSRTVGLVFQNPESQVIGITVLEDLAFGMENLGLSREEMWARLRQILEVVHLSDLLERETWALSGGQKQRLALGAALVMEPQVLVLDEPTAELDPQSKTEVFEIIDRLRRERHLTVVMIEHEVEALAEVADRILVMNQGRVVSLGAPREVFRQAALFQRVRERAPFVAEALAELVEAGLLPESEFTVAEDEAVALLSRYLMTHVED